MNALNECPVWTPQMRQRVTEAASFEGVADVVLEVLHLLPQPVVQVCGPISTGGLGCREKNMRVFARCICELRMQGMNVFDQVPLQNGFDRLVREWRKANPNANYCLPILETVYKPIFLSGLVKTAYFLPGWQSSFGTRWERGIVVGHGIESREFPMEWWSRILAELGLSLESEANHVCAKQSCASCANCTV